LYTVIIITAFKFLADISFTFSTTITTSVIAAFITGTCMVVCTVLTVTTSSVIAAIVWFTLVSNACFTLATVTVLTAFMCQAFVILTVLTVTGFASKVMALVVDAHLTILTVTISFTQRLSALKLFYTFSVLTLFTFSAVFIYSTATFRAIYTFMIGAVLARATCQFNAFMIDANFTIFTITVHTAFS